MLDKQTRTSQTGESTLQEKTSNRKPRQAGVIIERHFTQPGADALDATQWELRDAAITGDKGEVFFEQRGVEIPQSWSQLATNVVVQKYFRGSLGSPERESSVRQLIDRVSRTISRWGKECKYFSTDEDAEIFRNELNYLLVTQRAAFNSPVWFNVGTEEHPQCSACFINSVEDTMASILGLAKTEGMLFKWGSGTGTNFSALRGSREKLTGGGSASGPVSFMKGFDSFAGVIKSGGKTRRAAKMVILNDNHPDIMEFINCKASEEKKAWALIDAGYDGSFNGEAYNSVFFQNSNNSVRVTDEFMDAVIKDRPWHLYSITTGQITETLPARKVMQAIVEAAHLCGDPGLQFDTTINSWHTCLATTRINASNPCSEYMFVDDSACNLSSLNLRKFQLEDGNIDAESLRRAVRIMVLAQEIIVDNAKYPTEKITANSRKYRPLGLGYANLGALLMSRGLPYDSDAGRALAAAVTAIVHGEANRCSALIAADRGPFDEYEPNASSMMNVMERHRRQLQMIDKAYVPYDLLETAHNIWDEVIEIGGKHGFRNAQVTALAPTGTIGFMMDCDTTGIEPDIALVKYKKLVGGGLMKIVNNTVPEALAHLGYTEAQITTITDYIEQYDTIEGAPGLKDEHIKVFDCAFRPMNGTRSIHYLGHIRMMAAVQPFISGAISKTVNMPHDATLDDIEDAYVQAWRQGLKSIALYRDGCKRVQPLVLSKDEKKEPLSKQEVVGPPQAVRHKLPDERRSITHKFNIAGHEGYITVGTYQDGRPGEIFVVMAKEGSTISGLMDSFATAISLSLQHGVPLKLLVDKFAHTRFEPSGFSENPQIGYAKSIMDYIFRYLELKFPDGRLAEMVKEEEIRAQLAAQQAEAGKVEVVDATKPSTENKSAASSIIAASNGGGKGGNIATFVVETDAPACPTCGSIMVRNGACHKCLNCGSTSGCS